MIYHEWYKGEQDQIGEYIFRDDICSCGCVRRTVLNDKNKEEIESYTINDNVTLTEPICTRKKRKKYRVWKSKMKKILKRSNNR